MIKIQIEKPGMWVVPHRDMDEWLNSLPFNNWEWNMSGNVIIFYDDNDATAFRLKFKL